MTVTKDQAQMLATLATACRPNGARGWDAPGVMAAISKVAHMALADVACAVMRGAADRTLETPAAIGNPSSSCWRERVAEVSRPSPPKSSEACWNCGKAISASCCDLPARRPVRGPDPSPLAAQARAAIRAARHEGAPE